MLGIASSDFPRGLAGAEEPCGHRAARRVRRLQRPRLHLTVIVARVRCRAPDYMEISGQPRGLTLNTRSPVLLPELPHQLGQVGGRSVCAIGQEFLGSEWNHHARATDGAPDSCQAEASERPAAEHGTSGSANTSGRPKPAILARSPATSLSRGGLRQPTAFRWVHVVAGSPTGCQPPPSPQRHPATLGLVIPSQTAHLTTSGIARPPCGIA